MELLCICIGMCAAIAAMFGLITRYAYGKAKRIHEHKERFRSE